MLYMTNSLVLLASKKLIFIHNIISNGLNQVIRNQGAKKISIIIWMQFLNDIIKSEHGFKAAQKF